MGDDLDAMNRAIGETVRLAIQEAGSSARLATERAGLNYRSVRRYLAGERDMPVPVLLALVQASHVDLVQLAQRLTEQTSPQAVAGSERGSGRERDLDEGWDEPGHGEGLLEPRHAVRERLRHLGVTRLAARSIAPIPDDELDATLDVVEQIILELREDHPVTMLGKPQP